MRSARLQPRLTCLGIALVTCWAWSGPSQGAPRSPLEDPAVHRSSESLAHSPPDSSNTNNRSNRDARLEWPTWQQWRRVLSFRDYNTRVVVFCTTLLGCAAGIVGSFTLLRRRALMGDAISHATLPGVGLAFIFGVWAGFSGKSLLLLLLGATTTGLLGVAVILVIRNLTHLKEDTALGAVLSVFFGAGMALLAISQQLKEGHAAGLEAFIYGKTASMGAADAQLIAIAAALLICVCAALFREFKLLCFDDQFASAEGYPTVFLDLMLMSLVVIVTIVGLQAVGLILMIALLVIPAAAARFWTQRLLQMVLLSAIIGALSGATGAIVSAVFPKLPSGAMIVLVCAGFFLLSLLIGAEKGVLRRWSRRRKLNRLIASQHLLRAMYEILELRLGLQALADHNDAEELAEVVTARELLPKRSWSAAALQRELRRAARRGLVLLGPLGARFSQSGLDEAERLTRQHRLWEIYLIKHAEVATSRVDRDADAIEHVLEPEIISELVSLLEAQYPQFPASPHDLQHSNDAASRDGLRGAAHVK